MKGTTTRSAALFIAALVFATAGCGGSAEKPPAQQPTGQGATAPSQAQVPGKTLSLVLDGSKDREPELQAMAGYLRQIGVEAQVRTWEYQTLISEAKNGTRDAYATDWGSSTFNPFDLALPKLKTKDRGNFSFYSSAELDRLFDQAASSTDPQQAKDAYFKAQEILQKDAPWIFGYYRDAVEASSARVKNWKPATDSRINLHDVSLDAGDTLVVALRADRILSLDPANYRDRDTETVIRNIFDGLVTRTPDGEVVPETAESWTQPDPKTYVFKLRPGIKFHNGEALDADDVVFTFERILSPTAIDGKQSPRLGLLGPLEKVEKVDPLTVRFSLKTPSPVFLQLLVHTQIVPKDYVSRVGAKGLNEHPVGAGPFRFVSGRLDSQVTLERFDGYYGGSPRQPPVGPPSLKRAVFRMVPEAATRIAALVAGEVHIITEVPPDAIADLKSKAGVQVQVAKGTRLYMIELNNQKIADARVRQALNHAVNWDEILSQLYKGYAHRVATALLPSGLGYNPDLQPFAYDPAKAKALLKEAGYAVK